MAAMRKDEIAHEMTRLRRAIDVAAPAADRGRRDAALPPDAPAASRPGVPRVPAHTAFDVPDRSDDVCRLGTTADALHSGTTMAR